MGVVILLLLILFVGFVLVILGTLTMIASEPVKQSIPFLSGDESSGYKKLLLGGIIFFAGIFLLYCYEEHQKTVELRNKYNIVNTANAEDGSRCSMCGGEFKCAVCGEKGLHCEYASYGRGSDHYCSKHWGDVVEWHEEHDSK